MARYASETEVPVERSRAEIERILVRYGATAFAYGWQNKTATIMFEVGTRKYRVMLPLPDQKDPKFWQTQVRRNKRTEEQAMDAWEQACRQRWRALALWVKAVLEASESGITSLEESLQAFILLPNGQTVNEWLRPQIKLVYETHQMPQLLPGLPSGNEPERTE